MRLRDLGRRIRARREHRGLKQQDVANALNVSPQAVSKWERGENAPDITALAPLAQLLDVTVDWLLGADQAPRDVLSATVFVSGVRGAYSKSAAMAPRDFATWANGVFYPLTEATLQHRGVPVKYLGDQYLCFFTGSGHERRALTMTGQAKAMAGEDLKIGLAAGEIYVGAVGHPDYARPDIMGEVVNIAFLTMEWADQHSTRGAAATAQVIAGANAPDVVAGTTEVSFRGITGPVEVCELRAQDN